MRPRFAALAAVALLASCWPAAARLTEIELTVPPEFDGAQQPDSYVCTGVPMPKSPEKLVGVVPLAEQGTVHHSE
jgi:hypothetical protein